MGKLSRRQLMDIGLIGGLGLAGSALPFGRSFGLTLQPMDQETEALYLDACGTGTRHAAVLDALVDAARARDISVDEAALRRLLEGSPCPLCGCALTVG